MKIPKFTKDKVWETIAVMLFGFSVIILWTDKPMLKTCLLITNVVIGLTAIVHYPAGKLIVKAWWKFAEIIGGFMSRLLLSVVFFAFLTPIAIVYRLFHKSKAPTNSTWNELNAQFKESTFSKVW